MAAGCHGVVVSVSLVLESLCSERGTGFGMDCFWLRG